MGTPLAPPDHGFLPVTYDRTAEGRSRAQQRGQRMGRPPKLRAERQAEARRRRAEGATLAELASSYHVGKSTISRLTARRSTYEDQL